jgi:3-phosphoshikimate 1-carboxyvinyltransferase
MVEALGVQVEDIGPGEIRITSPGLDGLHEPQDVLDAANSGTTTRLMAGILATRPFCAVITGDESLRRRPMRRVVDPLTRMGATILGRDGGGLLPLTIRGGDLRAIGYDLPMASAQVKSAILLAGLGAAGRTVVREPSPSRDHTERMLRYLGAGIRYGDGVAEIDGGGDLRPFSLDVPGDISSAAFFLAAGALAGAPSVTLPAVGVNPTRTGVIDALRAMGADLTVTPGDDAGPEPVATLTAGASSLVGTEIAGSLIPRLLDELPVLALVATQARGRTVVRDAGELRVKESDRITTTVAELRRLGADIDEMPDGFVVEGPTPLHGARCQTYGDHRIAMMLAIAGLIASSEIIVEGAECVEVSFPGFFGALAALTDGVAAGHAPRAQKGA